jgi:hypothetical protein
MGSWRGQLHEESVREHGWFKNIAARAGLQGRAGALTGRVAAINGAEIRIILGSEAAAGGEDFLLTSPIPGVFPGDEVRIDFETDVQGHKIALRVVEISSRQ